MYVPTVIDQRGWRYFSIEYLSTLPGYGSERKRTAGRTDGLVKVAQFKEAFSRRESRAAGSSYESDIAAQVFQELNQGADADDIVIRLLVHPDTVANIYDAWIRLKTMKGGGIQISGATMAAINELPLRGIYPILNEEGLLANLREVSKDTPLCPSCKKRPPRICTPCAMELAEPVELPVAPARPVGRPRKPT